MGCGSSSTQVKEFRPLSRQDTPTFKTSHTTHTAIRENSDVSQKSKSKAKSSSTSSSASSLKERVKSGNSSRSSSAKSDRKVSEKEKETNFQAYIAPAVQKDELNDASKSKISDGEGTYDLTDSQAKSERRSKGATNAKENSDSSEKTGRANSAGLVGMTGSDGDDNDVTVSKPFEKTEDNENDIDETEYEFIDKHMIDENDEVVEVGKKTKSEKANEEVEYDEFSGFEFSPIAVPEINKNKEFPVYTLDDVVNNNAEKGKNNWFLYGRKVYTLDLFTPIVFSRVQEYLDMTNQGQYSADEILTGTTEYGSYPIYIARYNGVRKKEMDRILPASQIGKLVSISREEYLSRLKHCVDNVKSDLEAEEKLTEYLADYLEQLSRWLSSYPNVELEPPVDRTNVDPNQCEFPLPEKIRADSTVIRQWARNWEEFDTSVDEGGVWLLMPLLNEDWGDVHQTFVDTCAKREDVNLPEMNMEIEGEAAWGVIQLDIVKNDETTEQQEETWKAREKRKDLNDPERMRRRRKEIADSFLKRHDTRLKAEDMVQYGEWAHRLEEHWKEFQELCETFVQRRRVTDEEAKVPDIADLKPKKISDNDVHDEHDIKETEEPVRLPDNIPPQDTMSIRSDHGLN